MSLSAPSAANPPSGRVHSSQACGANKDSNKDLSLSCLTLPNPQILSWPQYHLLWTTFQDHPAWHTPTAKLVTVPCFPQCWSALKEGCDSVFIRPQTSHGHLMFLFFRELLGAESPSQSPRHSVLRMQVGTTDAESANQGALSCSESQPHCPTVPNLEHPIPRSTPRLPSSHLRCHRRVPSKNVLCGSL